MHSLLDRHGALLPHCRSAPTAAPASHGIYPQHHFTLTSALLPATLSASFMSCHSALCLPAVSTTPCVAALRPPSCCSACVGCSYLPVSTGFSYLPRALCLLQPATSTHITPHHVAGCPQVLGLPQALLFGGATYTVAIT